MTRYKLFFSIGLISGLICVMRPNPCIGYSMMITAAAAIVIKIYCHFKDEKEV